MGGRKKRTSPAAAATAAGHPMQDFGDASRMMTGVGAGGSPDFPHQAPAQKGKRGNSNLANSNGFSNSNSNANVPGLAGPANVGQGHSAATASFSLQDLPDLPAVSDGDEVAGKDVSGLPDKTRTGSASMCSSPVSTLLPEECVGIEPMLSVNARMVNQAEGELFEAIDSLYVDRLPPSVAFILKRLNEIRKRCEQQGEVSRAVTLDTLCQWDTHSLRSLCESSSMLQVYDDPCSGSGEWSAFLVGQPRTFVDVNSRLDPYPSSFWERAKDFFEGDGSGLAYPNDAYDCACILRDQSLGFLESFSLGHICQFVHLALQRGLLGHLNRMIVPAFYATDTPSTSAAEPDLSESGLTLQVADWNTLKSCLREILSVSPIIAGQRQVPLSNLKRLFRTRFGVDLNESALGYTKLLSVFEDVRLADVCGLSHSKDNTPCLTQAPGDSAQSETTSELLESLLLEAIESLYRDELRPYARIIRKRLGEFRDLALEEGNQVRVGALSSVVGFDLTHLRALCENSPQLELRQGEGGEWSALLVGRPQSFVDIYDKSDPYTEAFWEDAAQFFSSLPKPSGRVCHILQLAITKRNLLGYFNGGIVPYEHSMSLKKAKCAEQMRPCVSDSNESSSTLPSYQVADWESAKTCLQTILDESVGPDGLKQVPLSNVKRLFRSKYNMDLSETVLGYPKISALLEDPWFADICSVLLRGNRYVVVPHDSPLVAAPAPEEIPAPLMANRWVGMGREANEAV